MKPRGRILHQPVILLVEDEALFRTLEVEVLREAGFWVLEAQDADEAFECLKRRDDIKAVLTDVSMRGCLNGFEFARLVSGLARGRRAGHLRESATQGRRSPTQCRVRPEAHHVDGSGREGSRCHGKH